MKAKSIWHGSIPTLIASFSLAVAPVSAQTRHDLPPPPAPLAAVPNAPNGIQPPPAGFVPPPPPTGTVAPTPSGLDLLHWDSLMKELTPAADAGEAPFIFKVSNPTDQAIVIDHVQTSCGCTVAKLPTQPWVLAPHTNGEISVSVHLAGKSGTIWKTITVFSTNNTQKVLTVKVNLPENPQVMRMRNQATAMSNPHAIFEGQCATCHVDKAKGLFGKALYKEACGICHEAEHRASQVPDLHMLPHPTDYAFWKQIISDGKPNTMMPGFSQKKGGPLSDEQIASLAKVLDEAFPSHAPIGIAPGQPVKTSFAPRPVQQN